ncbi:hypothetical protein C8Q76DRAFT_773444 [Earliella scabrosa]|nr:hypothetical protein C8Q76DRAFT_773444 [Earliella scabrosa]
MAPRKKAGSSASKATPSKRRESSRRVAASTRAAQAATARNVRGRRGGLKDMPNMPLDILFEIFSLMHPRDLLNLARTSKDFRRVLMSRSSAPFWKAARQQVPGLPDCPPYLSEPAYANLAFFSHCHSCLKPNIKTAIWEFSVRYCNKCKYDYLLDYASSAGYPELIEDHTGVRGPLLNTCLARPSKGARYEEIHYHAPEVEDFKAAYNACRTFAARKEFVEKAKADVAMRRAHAEAMQAWKSQQEYDRSIELDAIKEARFEAIKDRLRSEGWGDELDLMPPYEMCRFSKHKSCRKSQRMTDHIWQTIREEMIGYMEEVRTKRLEQERFALLSARLTILQTVIAEWEQAQGLRTAETDWEPLFSDFAFMDIFRSLVEAPSEQIVRKQDFEAHLDDIPGMIESWLVERRLEFAAKVPITPTNDEVSPLSLAVASFSCKRCFRGGLRWPQILAHTCARHLILPPWPSTGHTGFIIQRHERMCEVIRACGRDPAVATHEDMESCGVRLICRKCVSPHGPCEVLDWKDATMHEATVPGHGLFGQISEEGDRHTPEFEVLDATHTSQAIELEALQESKAENDSDMLALLIRYGCRRCRSRVKATAIEEHCRAEHGIQDPAMDVDYYLHTDNRPRALGLIRIYPQARETDPDVVADIKAGRAFVSSTLFSPV